MLKINGETWTWGANRGARQHLFLAPMVRPSSLCGKAHGGDAGGVFRASKRLKCTFCADLERKAGQ